MTVFVRPRIQLNTALCDCSATGLDISEQGAHRAGSVINHHPVLIFRKLVQGKVDKPAGHLHDDVGFYCRPVLFPEILSRLHMDNHRLQGRIAVLKILRQKVAGQIAAAVWEGIQLLPSVHPEAFIGAGVGRKHQGVAESVDTASHLKTRNSSSRICQASQ